MSFNVTTHFVQQYTTNVQLLLQQKGSKLRGTVSTGSYSGKAAKAVEQVGAVNAQKRTQRHGDTPLISTPSDARWIYPVDYEWADLIDDQDKLRMLIDPQSSYAQNGAYALGRAMDDEIISAFFGTAKTGENGSTSTVFATGTQQISVSTGSTGATGLNIAKLREAKKILMENEVDIDNEQLFCVITAEQHDDSRVRHRGDTRGAEDLGDGEGLHHRDEVVHEYTILPAILHYNNIWLLARGHRGDEIYRFHQSIAVAVYEL